MAKRKKSKPATPFQLWGRERQTKSVRRAIGAIQELGPKAYTSMIQEKSGMDSRTVRRVLSQLSLRNFVHIRQMEVDGRMRYVYFLTSNTFATTEGPHASRQWALTYANRWTYDEYHRLIEMVDWRKQSVKLRYRFRGWTYDKVERKLFLLMLTTLEFMHWAINEDVKELKEKYDVNAAFHDTHNPGGFEANNRYPAQPWAVAPVGHWGVKDIWFLFSLFGTFLSSGLVNDQEFKEMQDSFAAGMKKWDAKFDEKYGPGKGTKVDD